MNLELHSDHLFSFCLLNYRQDSGVWFCDTEKFNQDIKGAVRTAAAAHAAEER